MHAILTRKFRVLTPALLTLALTGCGDSGGDPTGDPTGSPTGDSTGDLTGSTDTTDATTDATTGDTGPTPTTGEPTTGDITTGEPTTDATTTDATTTDATTTDATTGGATADCGFDDSVEWDLFGEVWQLRSADGQTCVWLERRDDSEPDVIYKAVPFTLLEFKAGHDGVVDHLTDEAKMSWMSTHHNWLDVGEAWSDTVRYRLEYEYSFEPDDPEQPNQADLSAIDEKTKAVLWGPVRLYPYKP